MSPETRELLSRNVRAPRDGRREGGLEPIGAILPRLMASIGLGSDFDYPQPARPLAATSAPASRALRAAARR